MSLVASFMKKRPLGRSRCKWVDNIKIHGSLEYIFLFEQSPNHATSFHQELHITMSSIKSSQTSAIDVSSTMFHGKRPLRRSRRKWVDNIKIHSSLEYIFLFEQSPNHASSFHQELHITMSSIINFQASAIDVSSTIFHEKRPLGRSRRKWVDNIKINL
jgi:flagellar hook-basal body complex protein FliE